MGVHLARKLARKPIADSGHLVDLVTIPPTATSKKRGSHWGNNNYQQPFNGTAIFSPWYEFPPFFFPSKSSGTCPSFRNLPKGVVHPEMDPPWGHRLSLRNWGSGLANFTSPATQDQKLQTVGGWLKMGPWCGWKQQFNSFNMFHFHFLKMFLYCVYVFLDVFGMIFFYFLDLFGFYVGIVKGIWHRLAPWTSSIRTC